MNPTLKPSCRSAAMSVLIISSCLLLSNLTHAETIVIPMFEDDVVPVDNLVYVAEQLDDFILVGSTGEFKTIAAALTSLANPEDPYKMVLQPGEHKINSPIVLSAGQSIVGAGRELSFIVSTQGSANGLADFNSSESIVLKGGLDVDGNANGLANLTLRVTPPPGFGAIGVLVDSAAGPSFASINNVQLTVKGDATLYGMARRGLSFVRLSDLSIDVVNSNPQSSSVGAEIDLGRSISNIRINVEGGQFSKGLTVIPSDDRTINHVDISVNGSGTVHGLEIDPPINTQVTVTLEDSEITASGPNGGDVFALRGAAPNDPVALNVRRSTITSDNQVATNLSFLFLNPIFSHSNLIGTVSGAEPICLFTLSASTRLRRNCQPEVAP